MLSHQAAVLELSASRPLPPWRDCRQVWSHCDSLAYSPTVKQDGAAEEPGTTVARLL